jgi:hypothetical protein
MLQASSTRSAAVDESAEPSGLRAELGVELAAAAQRRLKGVRGNAAMQLAADQDADRMRGRCSRERAVG